MVLLAIMRLGDDAYAVPVRDEIVALHRARRLARLDLHHARSAGDQGLPEIAPRRSDAGARRPRQAVLRAAAARRRGAEREPPRARRVVARPRNRAGLDDDTISCQPRAAPVRAVHPGAICASRSPAICTRSIWRCARGRGPARATAWLWWQSLRLALTFRWERVAHGRPLPPIADELRGFGQHVGRASAGHRLRRAHAAAPAGIHRRRDLRARARHRRQHRDLQRRRRRAVAAAAVSARRSRDVARRAAAAREPLVRSGRAGRLLRLAARQPVVLGDRGVSDDVAVERLQPDRRRRARARASARSDAGVPRRDRRHAGARPRLPRRGGNRRPPSRRPAQRRACGGAASAPTRRSSAGRSRSTAGRSRSSACCRRGSGGRRIRTSSCRWRWTITIARCARRTSSRRSAGCATACRRSSAREDLRIIGARLSQEFPGREREPRAEPAAAARRLRRRRADDAAGGARRGRRSCC